MKNMKGFTSDELYSLAWQKPIMAQIEITRNCNRSCLFCFQDCRLTKSFSDLPFAKWKICLINLAKIGIRCINLSGGENFMHPDFIKIVVWAKQNGFEIICNTNGTFDVEPILDYVDEIVFSVHGLNEIHDKITGTMGDFELVETNIAKANKKGKKFSINMVLIKQNYHLIMNEFNYFDKHYNIHKFSPVLSIKSLFGSKHEHCALEINRELILDYIKVLKQIPSDRLLLKHGFHSIFINDLTHYTNPVLFLPNCAGGKYKLVVEYNGDVYPCNFFKSKEYYCGNIFKVDPHDIWQNGRGFKIFRNFVLEDNAPDKCHTCLKKARCFAGCRAWTKTYTKGGFNNVKDERCELGDAYIGAGNHHKV